MAKLKTKKNRKSVRKFLDGVESPTRREDARKVHDLMEKVTGAKAEMWGDSIVGFGSYHYRYASGREGGWFLTGFSPRKTGLTLYIMSGFGHYEELLGELGTHKTGKSCLYINHLEDVDVKVLRKLVKESVTHLTRSEKERGT